MNTSSKLVSIIMPAFDAGEYVSYAIESVLAQSYTNWELIVVDDYSKDNTAEIVKAFCASNSRIKLFKTTENSGGPGRPRNIGLNYASGAFVAFLDSDDAWHKDKLILQIAAMEEGGYEFSATRVQVFKDHLTETEFSQSEAPINLHLGLLLRKNIIANSSVVVNKYLLKNFQFSEARRHVAVEDYLAWLQLHRDNDIKSILMGERLCFYRVQPESISRSKPRMIKKVYSLLSEFEVDGKPLGFKKYMYLMNYVWRGINHTLYK